MADNGLVELQQRLRAFAAERNWEQYHTPKNLTMALAAEVGELLEQFQWLTSEESYDIRSNPVRLAKVEDELADVMIYLAVLAGTLDVDLIRAANEKISRNADRFPIVYQPEG